MIKMENEQVEQKAWSAPQPPSGAKPGETNKNLSTSSKYEGLTAAMAAELMIGFWFGIGAILAIKMVNNLEELIRR